MSVTLLNYPVSRYEYYSGGAPSETDPLSIVFQEIIGKGAFSTVMQVKASNSEEMLAVKFPKTQKASDWNEKELAKLKFLNGKEEGKKYTIQLIASFTISIEPGIERVVLLFSKYKCSLANVIAPLSTKLATRKVLKVTEKLLETALFLKKHNIIHRDIKPENILMDYENNIKLADFALAVSKDKEMENAIRGTPYYISPELLSWNREGTLPLDFPSDMWAIACTIYKLQTKINLFQISRAVSKEKGCALIRDRHNDLWKGKAYPASFERLMQEERLAHKEDPEAASFNLLERILRAMLTLDPQERLTPESGLETFFPSP